MDLETKLPEGMSIIPLKKLIEKLKKKRQDKIQSDLPKGMGIINTNKFLNNLIKKPLKILSILKSFPTNYNSVICPNCGYLISSPNQEELQVSNCYFLH